MEYAFLDVLSNMGLGSSVDKTSFDKKIKDGQFNIVIDQARYPLFNIREIFNSYKLQPSYQRNRVWDKNRKSRLIESLIVNVPIPPVFLYETEINKFEVMDGLQRISTIVEFMNDEFELQGLEYWYELNGFLYSRLPEVIRNSINRRYLSATIILNESSNNQNSEDMKQFIFERLNTGGMELSPQEIRNAIFSGEFNKMLIEVTEMELYSQLVKLPIKDKIRMQDRELILRFFAYKSAYKNNLKVGTKEVLDLYAKKSRKLSELEVKEAKEYYLATIEAVDFLFKKSAFSKTLNSRFERMIYDTVMLAVSEIIDEYGEDKIYNSQNLIDKKFEYLNDNKEVFNGKYTAFSNVINRVDVFTRFLKENLSLE